MCSSLLYFLTRNFLAGKSGSSDWLLLLLCLSVCLSASLQAGAARLGPWHCWQCHGRQRWSQQTEQQCPELGLPAHCHSKHSKGTFDAETPGSGTGNAPGSGGSRKRQQVLPRAELGAVTPHSALSASAHPIPPRLPKLGSEGRWGPRDGH